MFQVRMSGVRQVALLAVVLCSLTPLARTQTHSYTNTNTADGPTWPRPRRQFPGGEWVPLAQPCPTCRPLADPSDARTRVDDIGLVPPRPPPTTRQVINRQNNRFFHPWTRYLSSIIRTHCHLR